MFTLDMSDTEWKIFDSSIDLFSAYGYGNVSMGEIAAYAGVSQTTMYGCFSSKKELLEQIIRYYQYYYSYFLPSLNSVMGRVEEERDIHILEDIIFRYPDELQGRMNKIFILLAIRLFGEPEADEAIDKMLFKTTEMYMKAVLSRFVELGCIKPLDIGAYVFLYNSLNYTASVRTNIKNPISWETWMKSFKMLLELLEDNKISTGIST